MPYSNISQAIKKHPNLKKYSKKAQEAWIKAFNNAYKNYKDESKSFAVAYSVANRIDKKAEDKVICVDFDSTIAENKYPDVGKPEKNVAEALKYLKSMGYHIKVYSCRTNGKENVDSEDQRMVIQEYLEKNGIPYDTIAVEDKPFAEYYIDDKAINYNGSWDDVLKNIEINRMENKIALKIANEYVNRIRKQ